MVQNNLEKVIYAVVGFNDIRTIGFIQTGRIETQIKAEKEKKKLEESQTHNIYYEIIPYTSSSKKEIFKGNYCNIERV